MNEQQPCQYNNQSEGIMGIVNFFQHDFSSDLLPVLYDCNLKHGLDHYVTMNHKEAHVSDIDYLKSTNFLWIDPMFERSILYNSLIEFIGEGWYCLREHSKNISCSKFVSICLKLEECIKASNVDLVQNQMPRFTITAISSAIHPAQCFSPGKGKLTLSLAQNSQV